jgi:hypothetical protein
MPALALVAALLLASCGDGEPERDAAGQIAGTAEVLLSKLRAGDCVGNLRHSLANPDGGRSGLPDVKAVACSKAHDAEVLKVAELGDGDFPGEQIVLGEVARGRQELQPRLASAGDARGKLTLVSFRPTQDRWEYEDQHEIVYLVLYAKAQRGTL